MSRRYGPYRRAEGIVPELWEYDDYEGVWRVAAGIPEWLHRQREQLAAGTFTIVREPRSPNLDVETVPVLPLPREVTRPFDGCCETCGTRLTTRASKRRKRCGTCICIKVNALDSM